MPTSRRSAALRLHLLGAVDLRRADGTEARAVLAQPKRLALLAYLAAGRPRGFQRRGRLLEMFWPEREERRGRDALNRALGYLRASLGRDVVVSRGRSEVGVDRARLWCDVTALDAAVEEERVEDVLELYRGDLLAGVSVDGARGFGRWVDDERYHLRRRVEDLMAPAAERARQEGREDDEERLLRALARLSPFDESVRCRLAGIYEGQENRGRAVRVLESLEEKLERELDLEPSAETLETLRRIRDRAGGEA